MEKTSQATRAGLEPTTFCLLLQTSEPLEYTVPTQEFHQPITFRAGWNGTKEVPQARRASESKHRLLRDCTLEAI